MKETLSVVTTIVLLVIYLPIIYLIIRRRKKKVTWFIILPLAILLFPVFFLIIWANVPYYYLAPFQGKVIDGETKQPIADAAVLVIYYGESASIQGASTYPVDAQETLTDEKGEFRIPEVKEWFGQHTGRPVTASIIIFKPSYGAFPRHRESKAIGENKTWPPPGKYVVYELPILKTREEKYSNVFDVQITYDLQFSKQKLIINKVNKEFENLQIMKRYIERKGKPVLTLLKVFS